MKSTISHTADTFGRIERRDWCVVDLGSRQYKNPAPTEALE